MCTSVCTRTYRPGNMQQHTVGEHKVLSNKNVNRKLKPGGSYVLRVVTFSKDLCRMLQSNPDVYYPTYVAKYIVKGKAIMQERPKIPGYAFIKTDDEQYAINYANSISGIFLASNIETTSGRKERIFMKTREKEMEDLKKVVDQTDGETQIYDPKDIDLSEGDKIKILGGPFDGQEGFVVSQNGKDNGIVYLQIADSIFTRPVGVAPETIRIIEFAKGTKHQYKKIANIRARIKKSTDNYIVGKNLSAKETDAYNYFLNRYSEVSVNSVKMQIDFSLTKLQIYMLLSQEESQEASDTRSDLSRLVQELEAQKTMAVSKAKAEAIQKHIDAIQAGLASLSEAQALRRAAFEATDCN